MFGIHLFIEKFRKFATLENFYAPYKRSIIAKRCRLAKFIIFLSHEFGVFEIRNLRREFIKTSNQKTAKSGLINENNIEKIAVKVQRFKRARHYKSLKIN